VSGIAAALSAAMAKFSQPGSARPRTVVLRRTSDPAPRGAAMHRRGPAAGRSPPERYLWPRLETPRYYISGGLGADPHRGSFRKWNQGAGAAVRSV